MKELLPEEKARRAAAKREYRRARRESGNPIKSGKSGKSGRTKRRQTLASIEDKTERALEALKGKRFVAWDSEGCTFDGDHRTVYFANSEGDELSAPGGIPPGEHYSTLIPWLYESAAKYPTHTHVFFSASYDWTMILRGLDEDTLKKIYAGRNKRGQFIKIGHDMYDLKLSPRRMLTIRKVDHWNEYVQETDDGKEVKRKPVFCRYTANFVDTFAFYQQSFVKAISCNLAGYPDLDLIIEGKKNRASESDLNPEMVAYCQAELRALVALVEKLRDELVTCKIPITRFWGAGSIASAMLKVGRMKEHLNPHKDLLGEYWGKGLDFEIPRTYSRDAAAIFAFFGARIEMLKYGAHTGPIYDDDINSCYPYALSTLPSFSEECGEWVFRDNLTIADFDSLSPFSMMLVFFKGNKKAPFYPFAHREKGGSIYYPRQTCGWHHYDEVKAARDAQHPDLIPDVLDITQAWEWIPNTDARPWGDYIGAKFAERKQLKKDYGTGGPEKILKLGLNSLYGKTAQRVGYDRAPDGTLTLPAYQDLYVAGYITAKARATLYTRGAHCPHGIVSFATDGVTSIEPLPDDNVGPNIGQWERAEYTGGLFVMAGVYTLYGDGGKVKFMARGYRPNMSPDDWHKTVAGQWEQGSTKLTISQTVFYGLGLALARKEPLDKLGQWEQVPRVIELTCVGRKRSPYGAKTGAHKRLLHTRPAPLNSLASMVWTLDYQDGWPYPFSFPSQADWLDNPDVNQAEYELSMNAQDVADYCGESFDGMPG